MEYKEAGVDIDAADHLVSEIKEISLEAGRKEVIGGIGQFAALFELPIHKYSKPVLVSSTDGVGTKLQLATKLEEYSGIGIDLVAMCVNDIAVLGAEPLFFLDYYATSKLNKNQAKQVIKSIALGCKMANIALVGGETAEMPNLYRDNDFDLAGFCVGCIEKNKILNPDVISKGDVLIGISSSGIHSNGFSLINYLINKGKLNLSDQLSGKSISKYLLTPTKIYVDILQYLFKQDLILASAHITGGGLVENIPRVLPNNVCAKININTLPMPDIFKLIQEVGNITDNEMYKVFNCGIGLVVVVKKQFAEKVMENISEIGEKAWIIGEIANQTEKKPKVCFI